MWALHSLRIDSLRVTKHLQQTWKPGAAHWLNG
jgi:hypothetical protein